MIDAPSNNAENRYIDRVILNGKNHTKSWLDHTTLMKRCDD
ncbi:MULTISPECIES: glycoside hydrolase domain-containing protein [unclassified Proteiniphilum]